MTAILPRPRAAEFASRPTAVAAPEVAPGLAVQPQSIVNVYLAGPPGAADRGWVLIDAGLALSAPQIRAAAAERFGPRSRPSGIVLTHGHFDHVGALETLASEWDVPVHAHPLELPYLTGRSQYPPPDPTVGGGMMALLSPLYPRGPLDLGERVHPLPADGTVPGMPGWRWLHTPGHTAGHISLFRDADRLLIAGDAFVTTRQESAYDAVMKPQVVWRPPAYYTPDWESAGRSVRLLASLNPSVAATGHGLPMRGPALENGLRRLADHFERYVPADGRYVGRPARADERGTVYVPPSAGGSGAWILVGGAVAIALGVTLGSVTAER
jgi:glyoxylase-like metal-dependent hydrolase (beta-lactamase superfamily II)